MSCAADATNTICFVLDAMVCSDVNTHTHSGWHTQFAGLLLRRGYSHRRLAAPPVCNSGDRVQHSVCHGASHPLRLDTRACRQVHHEHDDADDGVQHGVGGSSHGAGCTAHDAARGGSHEGTHGANSVRAPS